MHSEPSADVDDHPRDLRTGKELAEFVDFALVQNPFLSYLRQVPALGE